MELEFDLTLESGWQEENDDDHDDHDDHEEDVGGGCGCGCALRWRHNERDGISNHQPHDCLRNRLFRRRSRETPKLYNTGLCAGNSPVTS